MQNKIINSYTMKTKVTLLFVLSVLCIWSCYAEKKIKGNGVEITRTIELSSFNQIQYSGNIEWNSSFSNRAKQSGPVFEYTCQPGKSSLMVTIDENLYPYLNIQVTGGKLSLMVQNNIRIAPTVFLVRASSEHFTELLASGSMDFMLKSPVSGDELKIKASGATDIYMKQPVRYTKVTLITSGASDFSARDLECREIECSASGASDITLAGKAVKGRLKASGSGDISASKFRVDHLQCSASGSGDISAYANETIEARASGSGDISYQGKPSSVKRHESGAGDISGYKGKK